MYLVKALVLLALLLLFANCGPSMPPFCIAIFWAVLSVASAIGLTYHTVIRKAHRQYLLESGGKLSAINGGRFFSLVTSFLVSAVLIAGLVFELPKWGIAEWSIVVIAVPLYAAVFSAVNKLAARELKPVFQTSKAVMWSCVIVGALLCLAYLLICAIEPAAHYASATDAFLGADQPFLRSPSALLSETGKLVALVDGLCAYGMSKAAEISIGGFLIWKVVLSASAFFGVSNLLGTCALELDELKLVFQPLDAVRATQAAQDDWGIQQPRELQAAQELQMALEVPAPQKALAIQESQALQTLRRSTREPLVKRFVVFACVLPVVLAAGFLVADWEVSQEAQTEEYTVFEAIVRDHAGLAAYVLDGKYYEQQEAQELIEQAHKASLKLAQEREEVLVPLINEAFDQRIQNVDSYLDWYYSLPADYERLIQYFTGTVEASMCEQLEARINENIDESALDEKLEYYLNQSEELKANLLKELEQYEIEYVPQWLVVPAESSGGISLDEQLAPTQSFLNASQRMGLSVGAGVVAGIVAKKAAERILAKPFFNKIVAGLLEKLAARGLLAEGGTAIAPGFGTVIGLGVGFLSDFLFLKADEAMNRESYKEDITSALEESREEMLALARVS